MAERPPIGARIERARKLRRLTQQQLADLCGVSIRAVNDWENDRKYPNNVPLLEQVLGLSLENGDEPGPDGGHTEATMLHQEVRSLRKEIEELRNELRERRDGGGKPVSRKRSAG